MTEEEVRPVLSYTYFQEVIKKHKDLIWKVIELSLIHI